MKTSTLHSLITARTLHSEAARLVDSGDRHLCSAGLIMLQDALEIVFLALLVERGVDDEKSLESKGFDELIGELKKAGIRVPKSGTLKALNKQRVITKHYGQLAEPATVQVYADAAELALDSILPEVLGKRLSEVFITELLEPGEAKQWLTSAAALLEQQEYVAALTDIRKALFVEIEIEYAIHGWVDAEPDERAGFTSWLRGGHKAHYWTRNKEWISKNVHDPLDYVQINHEQVRLDAMEWGCSTAEIENLFRLTPRVFRSDISKAWHIGYPVDLQSNQGNLANARYCLDRAVFILLRKQQHDRARRWLGRQTEMELPEYYLGTPVFEFARQDSSVVHRIAKGYEYSIEALVSGFEPTESYYSISGRKTPFDSSQGLSNFIGGYLLKGKEEETKPLLPGQTTS